MTEKKYFLLFGILMCFNELVYIKNQTIKQSTKKIGRDFLLSRLHNFIYTCITSVIDIS